MILAVTAPEDEHAAAVVDLLRERDLRVTHIDVPSLSADTAVELVDNRWLLRLPNGAAPIDLATAQLGWWRRDPVPVVSRDVAALAEIDGAPVESTLSLVGALLALRVGWVTDPLHDRMARFRPVAWRASAAAGVPMPATLVTRDPAAALRFREQHLDAGVVTGPLVSRVDDWISYRPLLGEAELAETIADADAETVVQRAVHGTDVRVVAVGERLFAAELGQPAELPLETATMRPLHLPPSITGAILRMLGSLGLGTAAVDLRRDDAGAWWFVDLDPVPRWLYFEELTGLPVTSAMVELLASDARVTIR